jgi:hypothetical protein
MCYLCNSSTIIKMNILNIKIEDDKRITFKRRLLILIILFLFLNPGCSNDTEKITAWDKLVLENSLWPGETACWEGYNEGGTPGKYFEFAAAGGLRVDVVHPEYYTQIEPDGNLFKPGWQDDGHRGTASIDYTELLNLCDNFHKNGVKICFGLFIHNFEIVSASAMKAFLKKWSENLKELGINSIVFVPAWEVQGEWAAWPDGATRDCYIDPADFSEQMAVFKQVRDEVKTELPDGAEILLGAVLNGWINDSSCNKYGYTGWDYLDGLKQADWVGVDYYPVKVGAAKGPEAAFKDALDLYSSLTPGTNFAIFEYSINDNPIYGDPNWSEEDKITFIEATYELLDYYSFIKQIHWWLIGRGPGDARIYFE